MARIRAIHPRARRWASSATASARSRCRTLTPCWEASARLSRCARVPSSASSCASPACPSTHLTRAKPMSFERLMLIVVTVLLLAFVTLRYQGVSANITNSEPIGFYVEVGGLPHRGSLVQLRPLMKHLAGVPGDTIIVTASGSYVNGKLWPHSAIPKQTHGYKPYPFGTIRLQPNQYW